MEKSKSEHTIMSMYVLQTTPFLGVIHGKLVPQKIEECTNSGNHQTSRIRKGVVINLDGSLWSELGHGVPISNEQIK